jgi:Asp-tRNA(Asn)/Glu-tRNA(Gln) amidotransferase A subunit family amidase
VHVTQEGLPVGVQIMAPLGKDDMVFELAAFYEGKLGFQA